MSNPVDLPAVLDELRERVHQRLLDDTAFTDDCPGRLAESVRYSLLAPGKRIRPCLCLLACRACGGEIGQALPAASALEMVHCYSLIHDDLPAMDDDDLRRGRPTNHVQFGESTAILAGDGLLTLAFEVLARGIRPADTAVACVLDLASAAGVAGMVGGQQADLEGAWVERGSEEDEGIYGSSSPRPEPLLEQLEAIHRRKTGRLLTAALTMGGRCAGADPQTLCNLRIYGESVGLAFQIADDLLDVVGEESKMGKGVRKDAGHGKLTYPSLLGVAESRRRAEFQVERACEAAAPFGERGRPLTALARYLIERDH